MELDTVSSSKPSGTAGGPAIDAVRAYWDAQVDNWKIATFTSGTPEFFQQVERYRFEKLEYLADVVDFTGFSGQQVLDVGCGLANDLSRFAAGGAEVTGVDIAPRAIQLAEANFAQRGLLGEFHVMDGERLDFPPESFDAVYCHTVLQFTPDPVRMIQGIHRVLKPGGLAILMMVNRRSWMNLLRHVMRVEVDHLDAPVYHRVTRAEFRQMLSVFRHVDVVPERFPVPTRVHRGLKALLFNAGFVTVFNALPRAWTRGSGHHLMAFCRK